MASLPSSWRAPVAGLMSAGIGALALWVVPTLRVDLFAAGAARLAALLLGVGWERDATTSWLTFDDVPVAVTAGCSGTDFFLMVAALLGWRLARPGRALAESIADSLGLALAVTLIVNALRVVAVTQAHRWIIPHLPERHGAFMHMATGVAVFLPALIALNLVFELHVQRRPSARHV